MPIRLAQGGVKVLATTCREPTGGLALGLPCVQKVDHMIIHSSSTTTTNNKHNDVDVIVENNIDNLSYAIYDNSECAALPLPGRICAPLPHRRDRAKMKNAQLKKSETDTYWVIIHYRGGAVGVGVQWMGVSIV